MRRLTMLNSGSEVCGAKVTKSILGRNVKISEHAEVHNSILGNGVEVGAGAMLRNCIVDKHVKIPLGERIGYDLQVDGDRFTVSDNGIVVIRRGYEFDQNNAASFASASHTAKNARQRLVTA